MASVIHDVSNVVVADSAACTHWAQANQEARTTQGRQTQPDPMDLPLSPDRFFTPQLFKIPYRALRPPSPPGTGGCPGYDST